MLINVLINRVYWYEKNIIIVFNIQNNSGDMVKANIPTISEIEKSLKRTEICSFKGSMAGVLRLELRLVVLETIVLTIDTIPLYSLIDIYVSIFYSIFQYKIEISSCFFVLDTVYYYLEDCRIRSFYATFILSNLFISYDTCYFFYCIFLYTIYSKSESFFRNFAI